MTKIDFDQIREGLPGCPSDLKLWRLSGPGLDPADAGATRSHVDGCAACQARMTHWAAGFDALPGADPVRTLAAIQRRAAEPASTWGHLLRRALAPLAIVGAATAAIVLVQATHPPDSPAVTGAATGRPSVHRTALHVSRQVGGVMTELSGDQAWHPGDRLTFNVDVNEPVRVALLHAKPSGGLDRIWPAAGDAVLTGAGRGQRLAELVPDEAWDLGRVYLVACAPGIAHEACAAGAGQGPPVCQAGCVTMPAGLAGAP